MLRASCHTAAGTKDNETLYAILVTSFANTRMRARQRTMRNLVSELDIFKHTVETSATSGDHDELGQAALKWIREHTNPYPVEFSVPASISSWGGLDPVRGLETPSAVVFFCSFFHFFHPIQSCL